MQHTNIRASHTPILSPTQVCLLSCQAPPIASISLYPVKFHTYLKMYHERLRAGRTYFYSEFSAPSTSTSLVRNLHKAASNEHLSVNWKSKHSKSRLSVINHCIETLTKAHSTQELRKEDRKSSKLTASCASTAEETDPILRLEFEQELEEHLQKLLKKSRSNAVSVPSSVKFSVTGDAPNRQPQLAFAVPSNGSTMSRPRSPKSKVPQQLEGLDQLLHNIRQQLVSHY